MTKYYKALLFSLIFPLLAYSGIRCDYSGNGEQVTCYVEYYDIFPDAGITNSNGEVTCATCVNMTPDTCNELRTRILNDLDSARSELNIYSYRIETLTSAYNEIAGKLTELSMLQNMGNGNLTPQQSLDTNYLMQVYNYYNELDNFNEYCPNINISQLIQGLTQTTVVARARRSAAYGRAWGCVRGLYNFYLITVEDQLALSGAIENLNSGLEQVGHDIGSARSTAELMSCSSCKLAESDSGETPGGGSGSSAGELRAILSAVQHIQANIQNIAIAIAKIESDVDAIKKNTADTVEALSQINAWSSLSENVFDLAEYRYVDFYDDYLQNTTNDFALASLRYSYLTNRYLNPSPSQGGGNTNWFERIEILLASLVFPDSSFFATVSNATMEVSETNLVSDVVTLSNVVSQIISPTVLNEHVTEIEDVFNGFKELFETMSDDMTALFGSPASEVGFSVASGQNSVDLVVGQNDGVGSIHGFCNVCRTSFSLIWLFIDFVVIANFLRFAIVRFIKVVTVMRFALMLINNK